MDKLIHLQALLLKWLRHYNVRTIEQIRIVCRSLCTSNNLDEKNSVLKLLYPLLRMGYVEFIGDGNYQVSQSVIIYYPKASTAVGVNFTDEQKEKLKKLSFNEDAFGTIRFQITPKEILQLHPTLNCHYQEFNNNTPFVHFPKVKHIVTTFEECNSAFNNVLFYNNHKWEKGTKQIGIFKTSSDSHIFYLGINEKTFKIPLNTENPESWILAECYQICNERDDIFIYNRNNKTLTIKNFNLPILVERILRLNSLYQDVTIQEEDFQISFPNILISTVKELNRIFDTKTTITNG
jgi:hypothetical protein